VGRCHTTAGNRISTCLLACQQVSRVFPEQLELSIMPPWHVLIGSALPRQSDPLVDHLHMLPQSIQQHSYIRRKKSKGLSTQAFVPSRTSHPQEHYCCCTRAGPRTPRPVLPLESHVHTQSQTRFWHYAKLLTTRCTSNMEGCILRPSPPVLCRGGSPASSFCRSC
jgi:hypothetical protein